jgi:hypothetical protein
LLAKAVCQSNLFRLSVRIREQARSHKGPMRWPDYSVMVGILRGAMKYIHVSAMKYIAGIRVNNTV